MGRLNGAVLLQNWLLVEQNLRLHLSRRLLLRHRAEGVVIRSALEHRVDALYLRGNVGQLYGSFFAHRLRARFHAFGSILRLSFNFWLCLNHLTDGLLPLLVVKCQLAGLLFRIIILF